MVFVGNMESNGKRVVNDMVTNTVALFLYDKFLKEHLTSPSDSELVAILKAAGVVTTISELTAMLRRAGYNLNPL